jgi:hypothetical protein
MEERSFDWKREPTVYYSGPAAEKRRLNQREDGCHCLTFDADL